MKPLEHEVSDPFADTLPEPGRRIEAAPGLHWLHMPLPFAFGESLAHSNALWHDGALERVIGEDEVVRFSAA